MAYIPELPRLKEEAKKSNDFNILGKTLVGALVAIAFVLVFAGITYAYWNANYSQNNTNKITSGCFELTMVDTDEDNSSTSINLINTYPMTEEEAMKLKPYKFTITNNCSVDIHYNVTLNTTGNSDLDGILNYKLIYDNNEIGPKILNTAATYEPYNNYTYKSSEEDTGYNILNSYILSTGSLAHATLDNNNQVIVAGGSRTYQLYLWIDESVEDTSTMNKNFEGKILITSSSQKVCRRATELHTEICNQTGYTGCRAAGYVEENKGTTITYGNLGTQGILTSGDAFDCDVNGDGIYDVQTERFYYISNYYNTNTKEFEDDTAVLIYYNNTTLGTPDNTSSSLVRYYDTLNNWYGPVVAKENLPTRNQWKNVNLKNIERAILNENNEGTTKNNKELINNFNYNKFAARLLTYQELSNSCENLQIKNCNYLLENLKYSDYNAGGTWGYWLETVPSNDSGAVWGVYYNNVVATFVTTLDNGGDRGNGVRPAIEVPISDIEY